MAKEKSLHHSMKKTVIEVNDMQEIVNMLEKCNTCNVAFKENEFPYVIPMNFGYYYENEKLSFIFHGTQNGEKLELKKTSYYVTFSMNCGGHLLKGDPTWDITMEYESISGNGELRMLGVEEKIEALYYLMKHYSGGKQYTFGPEEVKRVNVIHLKVNEIIGKKIISQGSFEF